MVIDCDMGRKLKNISNLEPGKTYHIYNRSNDRENLFRDYQDHLVFLEKFDFYLSNFLDIYCHNLLPNHFHFLIKLRSEEAITAYLQTQQFKKPFERKYLDQTIKFDELLEREFTRLFISYSMYYNKKYNRKGNLFYRPFKRLEIEKDSQFTGTVVYIHVNALKHKLVKDFTEYPWSSWAELIGDKATKLARDYLYDWFGSRENMINAHRDISENYYGGESTIEDD